MNVSHPDLDAIRAENARTRASQGLPPTVQDEPTIRRVAAILAAPVK